MVVKKRIPTSLKVDPELWEEVKIMAIRTHKNITEYFEDALREKLVKDYEVVAAENKRKEQEKLHNEQVKRQYEMIVGREPGREVTQPQQPQPPHTQPQEQAEVEVTDIHTTIDLLFQSLQHLSPQAQRQLQQLKEYYHKWMSGKSDNMDVQAAISILNDVGLTQEVSKKLGDKGESLLRNFKSLVAINLGKKEYEDKWQPQQQEQYQWPYKEDSSRPKLREDETIFPFYLPEPGFDFPTTKEKVIQHFEKLQRETGKKHNIELGIASGLSDDKREYSKSELEGELSKVARHKVKITLTEVSTGKIMKIVGVVIETEYDPWKEKEKRLSLTK
jgi:hypothetical protein